MTKLYPMGYIVVKSFCNYFEKSAIFRNESKTLKGKQMDTKKLGKKIKLARVERDLTQTQLANKIKAKQKSISRYETGASLPSIETLVKLAKTLKKPAGYFLDE